MNGKRKCIAYVERSFYVNGVYDGHETEFIYDNHSLADQLLKCETLSEVRALFDEHVISVKFKDRIIK